MIAMWLMSIIPCRSCRERCGSAAAQATVVPESGGTDHAQVAASPSAFLDRWLGQATSTCRLPLDTSDACIAPCKSLPPHDNVVNDFSSLCRLAHTLRRRGAVLCGASFASA